MKKTILAISIVSAMMSGNVFAISNEDLLDIDNILNIDTKGETKKDIKKTTENNSKKNSEKSLKNDSKKDNKKSSKNESDVKVAPKQEIVENKNEEILVVKPPMIPVPITGEHISLTIDIVRDRLVKTKVGSNEVIISNLNKIEPKFEKELEVKEFIDSIKSFSAVSVYQEDKDVFLGKKVSDDLKSTTDILGDIKTGYSYFVNLVEIDKKMNRAKLRVDINVADIESYNETKIQLEDGSFQKIKIPSVITTNSSKVFWIDLGSGNKINYKIDDIYLVRVEVQRVIPFINQVFVIDHEKIKQMEETKKQEEIDKIEDIKDSKVKDENEIFDSLEKSLNDK
jgi:hypothetical protein